MIYIFWTAAHEEEAKRIVKDLLEKKWIACASLLPKVLSIYRWEGKVEESWEVKVFLKSKRELFQSISSYIQTQGSYDVPEIASIATEEVLPAYLDWLDQSVESIREIT